MKNDTVQLQTLVLLTVLPVLVDSACGDCGFYTVAGVLMQAEREHLIS